jgi:hypothetical protein
MVTVWMKEPLELVNGTMLAGRWHCEDDGGLSKRALDSIRISRGCSAGPSARRGGHG